MKIHLLFAASAAGALLLLASACGSKSITTTDSGQKLANTPENLTPVATVTSSATVPPGGTPQIGPAPVLGGNITRISPENGAKISQAQTTSPDPRQPRGICAEVNFKDLPENFQWFQMAVDTTLVTEQLTLVAATRENPQDGKLCYAPAEGLSVGRHTVALAVQAPRNPEIAPRQIVSWAFDVIP